MSRILQGLVLMLSNRKIQAFIQGVNDDFLIACIITLIGVNPVLWLREVKKHPYPTEKVKREYENAEY